MTQDFWRAQGLMPYVDKRPDHATCYMLKDTRFHDLYIDALERIEGARVVFIIRDPRAVLYSWWTCKEFPPDADLGVQWRTGACRKDVPGEYWGFDDWLLLTRSYLERREREPHRCLIIRYEDLVDAPMPVTRDMFDFCGLALGEGTRRFLLDSHAAHSPHPYSVFKSPTVKTRWQGNLPAEIERDICDAVAGVNLTEFLRAGSE